MGDYFCGWYFKCQSETQTLAVIPAIHTAGGKTSCSLQLITDSGQWWTEFPSDCFQGRRDRLPVEMGGSRFSTKGLRLEVRTKQLTAQGELTFGKLTPPRYDIMGPFRYVPCMECRHSVFSMGHSVNGTIWINKAPYRFEQGVGYLEGDRGRSFPRRYVWTQCSFDGGSLMLSAAEIPMAGVRFTGVIGAVVWQGREYRLATYLGARAVRIRAGEVLVRQGGSVLTARLLEKHDAPLRAPAQGAMSRTIHESAACRALYRFEAGGEVLFSFESARASFEYEYPD